MSRIIVEYNPPLSVRVQKIIRNEVTASMISNDEMTSQYAIGIVRECLSEIARQNIEDFEVDSDIELINKLIREGVSFVEF